MKKMLFVFNPCSGKGLIKGKLAELVDIFTKAGYEITTYPTQSTGDAYNRIKDADGQFDCLVCSGGDGTLNEVIGAVIDNWTSRPQIGYIPAGSTNDFATTLGIPKAMDRAADVIVSGKPFPCDIGKFNNRFFNYVAAFGVFSDVSYSTPQSTKNVMGHQAYVLEGFKSLSKIESHALTIRNGNHVITGNFLYGMVSNAKSVGGIKGICGQEICLNDGLLEVTFVREPKNPIDMQYITSGLFSKNEDNPMVERFKTDSLVIESEKPIAWALDGEYGDSHTSVSINVIPKAVDLMVPDKTIQENIPEQSLIS